MKLHHFVAQPEEQKKHLQELGRALKQAPVVEAKKPIKKVKPIEMEEEDDGGMDAAIMTLASHSRHHITKVKNHT